MDDIQQFKKSVDVDFDLEKKINAKNCRSVGDVCYDIKKALEPEANTNNFLLIIGGIQLTSL